MLWGTTSIERDRPPLHLVQFYPPYQFPASEIAAFALAGFRRQEPALFVATKRHYQEIANVLAYKGIDPQEWQSEGRFFFRDAQEVLEDIRKNGAIDLTRSLKRFKEVTREVQPKRIFGEIVALLTEHGDHEGALAVERVWNEALNEKCHSLYCAYPYAAFFESCFAESFCAICDEHDQVVESADCNELTDFHPWLSALERQTARVRREVARRQSAEKELQEKEEELARYVGDFARERIANPIRSSEELTAEEQVIREILAVCASAVSARGQEMVGSPKWRLLTGEILGYAKLIAELDGRGQRRKK